MISDLLSDKISNVLSKYSIIEEINIEYYAYIISWIIDYTFFNVLFLGLGLLLHKFLHAVIFVITLFLLRSCSGGTHAPTRIRCFVISSVIFLAVMYTCNLNSFTNPFLSQLILFFCLIIITILSPVIPKGKKANQTQKRRLKILSIIVCLSIFVLYIFLTFVQKNEYCNILIMCVMICTSDLVFGYIYKRFY